TIRRIGLQIDVPPLYQLSARGAYKISVALELSKIQLLISLCASRPGKSVHRAPYPGDRREQFGHGDSRAAADQLLLDLIVMLQHIPLHKCKDQLVPVIARVTVPRILYLPVDNDRTDDKYNGERELQHYQHLARRQQRIHF